MATVLIGHLGNGTGKIYEVKPSGVVESYPNTWETFTALVKRANGYRTIHPAYKGATTFYTESFVNLTKGSLFKLDSNAGAVNNIVDSAAIDITNYIVLPTKIPVVAKTIATDAVTSLKRHHFITNIILTPQTGNVDDLTTIDETEAQEGDIVILTIVNESLTQITVKNADAGSGHLRTRAGKDFTIKGRGAYAAFMKRTGAVGWQEIFRTEDDWMQLMLVDMVAGGGLFDPITDATNPLISTYGIVLIDGNSNTITAPWVINSTTAAPKKRIEVRMKQGITAFGPSGSLAIFGINISQYEAQQGDFSVFAIWDDTDADPLNHQWIAWLVRGSKPTFDGALAGGVSAYVNASLIGKATKDFSFDLGGLPLTFGGAVPSGVFTSGTGTIAFATLGGSTYFHLVIHN